MDSLVVCACSHTIVAHESGRCAAPQCDCELGSSNVLGDAIERLKNEHRVARA